MSMSEPGLPFPVLMNRTEMQKGLPGMHRAVSGRVHQYLYTGTSFSYYPFQCFVKVLIITKLTYCQAGFRNPMNF